jgi:hypothetical protein
MKENLDCLEVKQALGKTVESTIMELEEKTNRPNDFASALLGYDYETTDELDSPVQGMGMLIAQKCRYHA